MSGRRSAPPYEPEEPDGEYRRRHTENSRPPTIVAIAAILVAIGTLYSTYFDGAQFVYFLLGPATAAIALPLYKNWPTVRRKALRMLAALVAGATIAIVSAVAVAAAWDVPRTVLISLAPKSVTAAVAMSISDHLGGMPALIAVLVIVTGDLGAVIVTPVMNVMGLRDYAARAFSIDPLAGTMAGIAMGLNAMSSSLLVSVFVRLFIADG